MMEMGFGVPFHSAWLVGTAGWWCVYGVVINAISTVHLPSWTCNWTCKGSSSVRVV